MIMKLTALFGFILTAALGTSAAASESYLDVSGILSANYHETAVYGNWTGNESAGRFF